jgi:hypothetical protein
MGLDHPISLCSALAQAARPIALITGDLADAEQHVALLIDMAAARPRCLASVMPLLPGPAGGAAR